MGKKILWVLLLGALLPVAVSAAPRVVVSVPALHSLVAALTQGGIEPGLLMWPGTTPAAALDDLQKAELLAADMILWAGPGLESDLGEVLGRMPALARKSMALTNSIPLLTRAGHQGPGVPRWQSREPAFWTDPRLAMLVVHKITPQLVRLDPEHQELYLANEMALMMQLHGLEAEIADRLGPAPTLSADLWVGIDHYLRHRFLDSAMILESADRGLRKVSDAEVGANPCVDSGPAGIAPGPSFYFEAMRVRAQAVATCLLGTEGAKAAAESTAPRADAS
jgi:zinc transport system substrate-binding protein